jgi:cytochrome c biogenesis protein CcmG/thiol:disulfide interchange protein DsbE
MRIRVAAPLVLGLFLLIPGAFATVLQDVKAAVARKDFAAGESLVAQFKAANGTNPEYIEAYSWLARGALIAKDYSRADKYAAETKKLALGALKNRKLDQEPRLPLALGAAIEVEAQSAAARGERDQAVLYLQKELARYRTTSIGARIQKNINLLSLEGKPAPLIETGTYLGPKPPTLASLKGKPVLLFLWAHWCGDCKNQAPIIAQVRQRYAPKGLVVLGPTQRYGYAEAGREVPPAEELRYIDQVRHQFYAPLLDMPAPVSEASLRNYGVSTTPTLVLIDRAGIVRLYHPGAMSAEELDAAVSRVI